MRAKGCIERWVLGGRGQPDLLLCFLCLCFVCYTVRCNVEGVHHFRRPEFSTMGPDIRHP